MGVEGHDQVGKEYNRQQLGLVSCPRLLYLVSRNTLAVKVQHVPNIRQQPTVFGVATNPRPGKLIQQCTHALLYRFLALLTTWRHSRERGGHPLQNRTAVFKTDGREVEVMLVPEDPEAVQQGLRARKARVGLGGESGGEFEGAAEEERAG